MLPKATGREAALEKKAARRQEARRTLSPTLAYRVSNSLQALAHSAQQQRFSLYEPWDSRRSWLHSRHIHAARPPPPGPPPAAR